MNRKHIAGITKTKIYAEKYKGFIGMEQSKTNEQHRKMRILLRVLIVVSIVFAWGHSLIPAEESSEESGFVLELLKPLLRVFISEEMITELFIRKLAHFCEYALMGFEMSAYAALIIRIRNEVLYEETDNAGKINNTNKTDNADKVDKAEKTENLEKKTYRNPGFQVVINTVFCGFAVAFIDETIQTFSPGRGPEIADVWLDMGGFACGGMFAFLICVINMNRRKKRPGKKIRNNSFCEKDF